MTTPTQEQIKSDVVSLLPAMIGCTSFDLYYWIDTGRPITSREWLMVAHEAEKLFSGVKRFGYINRLSLITNVVFATADQRLEAIHRVCFPEKWRDE